ncbi:MAG TPA: hypothetical protein PKA53_12350 [Sphingobacterium sp.]|nr:hypothetical protein [Sphingobacterium sp.]
MHCQEVEYLKNRCTTKNAKYSPQVIHNYLLSPTTVAVGEHTKPQSDWAKRNLRSKHEPIRRLAKSS